MCLQIQCIEAQTHSFLLLDQHLRNQRVDSCKGNESYFSITQHALSGGHFSRREN